MRASTVFSSGALLTVAFGYALQAGCLFPGYTFTTDGGGAGGTGGTGGSTNSTLVTTGPGSPVTTSGPGGAPSTTTTSSVTTTTGPGTTTTTGSGVTTTTGSGVTTTTTGTSAATTTTATTSAASSTTSTGSGGGIQIAPGDMIDDMEEGKGTILKLGGRNGSWYTYNDKGDPTQLPNPFLPEATSGSGAPGSLHAIHTSGTGYTTWGGGIGFDFHLYNTGAKPPYDVSAYTGITFWAKGTPSVLVVKVPQQGTVAIAQGGTCSTADAGKCGDDNYFTVPLTAQWAQKVVPFSKLTQDGFGVTSKWDPKTALSVQFESSAATFDFWIDDVGFYVGP